MKHLVIRCKSEKLRNLRNTSTVYFDPVVDNIESINDCAITIPNLTRKNGGNITLQVNANNNLCDIQAPRPPENVLVSNYVLNLRVFPANRTDVYLDVAIDISIDKGYVGISSLNPVKCTSVYRHTSKKAFGIDDEGLKYNARTTLSNLIFDLEKGSTNLLWDIFSIKVGDFYVETIRRNWLTANGLKARLTVYRKTK